MWREEWNELQFSDIQLILHLEYPPLGVHLVPVNEATLEVAVSRAEGTVPGSTVEDPEVVEANNVTWWQKKKGQCQRRKVLGLSDSEPQ